MYYLVLINGELAGKTWTHEKLSGEDHIQIDKAIYDLSVDRLYLKNGDVLVKSEIPSDGKLYKWDSDNESWVYDLSGAQKIASERIDTECKQAILAGYESDALGKIYLYPSKQTDQLNMIASVADSNNPENSAEWVTPFWCADESGQWEFREHTATQIRRAGAAGKAAIAAAQLKNAQLQAQIAAATTAEEIEAITWSN